MKESKNESDRTQESYDFLSYSDRQELQKVLGRSYQNHSIESKEELEESKFSYAVYCHHCGCAEKVQKYGKQNGIQTNHCKDCRKCFTTLSSSIFNKIHKNLLYGRNM